MYDVIYGNLLRDELGTWSERGVHITKAYLYSFLKHNPKIRPDQLHIIWNSDELLYLDPKWKSIISQIYPTTFTDIAKTNIIDSSYNPLCITDTLIEDKISTERDINKVAIVVHAYYYEFWQEIYSLLQNIPPDITYDVYVYVPEGSEGSEGNDIVEEINNLDKSNIFLEKVPNKGRDIGSFLKFINDDKWRGYDAICKVHTKKTTHQGVKWRTELLHGTLGASDIQKCITALKTKDSIGCNKHLISSSSTGSFHTNIVPLIEDLYKVFNRGPMPHIWRFYAGTMFWISPVILHTIQQYYKQHMTLHSSGEFNWDIFPDEPASNDNTILHAWERMFGILSGI